MPVQKPTITLVAQDGSTPAVAVPSIDPISIAQYEDAEIPYVAIHADGSDLDLTGWSVVMTVRRVYYSVDPPPISRAAVPSSVSAGILPVGAADTAAMVIDPLEGYRVDVEGTDPDGKRWQLRAPGDFFVTETEGRPDAPVTEPVSYPPAGQGPPGAPIVWRRVYDDATTYAPLDEVSFDVAGVVSSYICIAATTGNDPTDTAFWDLSASGAPSSGLPDPATFPDGAVPVVRSGVWIFGTRLTQDDIDAGFSISSFNGAGSYASTKELGDTIVNPSFTASYSATPASATINDGDGALALTTPFTSFAYSGGNAKTYTKTAIGAAVTWLLTAIGATTKTASRSSTWLPRVFYDAAVPAAYDAAFIAALTGQTLASGFARTIAYGDAGGTKKLYYAFPAAFGTPSLFKDAVTGFGIPFSKVATVSVTNGFGVVTSYDLWASDNILTGAFTVVIS